MQRLVPGNPGGERRLPHATIKAFCDRVPLLTEESGEFVAFRVAQHERQEFLHTLKAEAFDLLHDPVECVACVKCSREVGLVLKRLQGLREQLDIELPA
jgi:hypothetical protein